MYLVQYSCTPVAPVQTARHFERCHQDSAQVSDAGCVRGQLVRQGHPGLGIEQGNTDTTEILCNLR